MKRIMAFALLTSLAIPQQSLGMHRKKAKKNAAQAAAPSLEGKWMLTYIEGGDVTKLYKGRIPEMIFDLKAGKITGNNGCNSIFGTVKVEGSKIVFLTPLGSTKMACEGNGEELFMAGLAKMTSFSFHGNDEIDLIGGDLGIMRLQRKK